jgi:hypothetical protein
MASTASITARCLSRPNLDHSVARSSIPLSTSGRDRIASWRSCHVKTTLHALCCSVELGPADATLGTVREVGVAGPRHHPSASPSRSPTSPGGRVAVAASPNAQGDDLVDTPRNAGS